MDGEITKAISDDGIYPIEISPSKDGERIKHKQDVVLKNKNIMITKGRLLSSDILYF